MRPRDTRLNTPAEMLVRFVFASRYIFFLCGLCLTASAVANASYYEALKAAVFFSAMFAGDHWLRRRGALEKCSRDLDAMFSGNRTDEEDALESLLQRREALEEKRGTPGFDPWAVQAVRREINDYVRQHPDATSGLR